MPETCPILDETPAPPTPQGAPPPMASAAPFPPDPFAPFPTDPASSKLQEFADAVAENLNAQAHDRAVAIAASVVLKCASRVGHSWHTDPATLANVRAEAEAILRLADDLSCA